MDSKIMSLFYAEHDYEMRGDIKSELWMSADQERVLVSSRNPLLGLSMAWLASFY
jgi:hypothetical protein